MIYDNSTTIEGHKIKDENILSAVLLMAQQTMYPELYEAFLEAYDHIIEVRDLPLEKLSLWQTKAATPRHL